MRSLLDRRCAKLINPSFQFRYLLLPVGVCLLTSTFLLTLFYIVSQTLVAAVSYSQSLQTVVAKEQAHFVAMAGLATLLNVVIVTFLGIKISHRIAGPIVNMKRTIGQFKQGDAKARVHLRQGDMLQDLAEDINGLLVAMEDRQGSERKDAAWDSQIPSESESTTVGSQMTRVTVNKL